MRAYILLLLIVVLAALANAQEVPLERCDRLHVISVKVDDRPLRFLVDTGATTILNLRSFAAGSSKSVEVYSWTGVLATSAREVTLEDLVIGNAHLRGLKLAAIDLSPIGNACGKRIDGILGADLIEQLGATLDLKREVARFASEADAHDEKKIAEMHHDMTRCVGAFNDSNEKDFQDCLDPKIILFGSTHELYGREQTLSYFHDKYFDQSPPAHFDIHQSNYRVIGDAVWYEYDFTLTSARGVMTGRGMAMCRKSAGKWRMASMHHSVENVMTGSAGPAPQH